MIKLAEILNELHKQPKQDIKDIKFFYHATDKKNLSGVLAHGLKASKMEGGIYLASSFFDAAKFLAFRGLEPHCIIVFKVIAAKLDKNKLSESFDHNENVFNCKAYFYADDIKVYAMDFNKIMTY